MSVASTSTAASIVPMDPRNDAEDRMEGRQRRRRHRRNNSNRSSFSSEGEVQHGKTTNETQQGPKRRSENASRGDGSSQKMARMGPNGGRTWSRSPEALSRSQNGSRQSQQNQTVKLKQQPKAPNNTTSFLMSDREERQHKEEVADGQQLTAVGRPRCYSTLERFMNSGAADNVAVEEAEEEQQDADFEECLLTTAIERIEGLSREEVNRELLLSDRDNRALMQRMAQLRENQIQLEEENQKLRRMLEANGVKL